MTGFQFAVLETVPNRRFWHVAPAGRCYVADDRGRFTVEHEEDLSPLLSHGCVLVTLAEAADPIAVPITRPSDDSTDG